MLLLSLAALTYSYAVVSAQPCNPLESTCTGVMPGFIETYSVDFTQQSGLPSEWILADDATVTFSEEKGANFSFLKRYDAPYIWTRKYFLFGRIDVELQAAPGNGLITGAVIMSDDKDELDFEFSGNNFGQGQDNGLVQTNWFGKGITGSYSRGSQQAVDSPQTKFHTYSYDWTKDSIRWILDGNEIHQIKNNGEKSGEYQFPQTPSRLHLGIWNAGDPDTPTGTMNWAGGLLDMSKVPYSAYVKSVKITPYTPCPIWQYPSNFSGNWEDVKCTTNQTDSASLSSATSSAIRAAATAYTVKAGDNGLQIAQSLGCSFEELEKINPGVNWGILLVGQSLNIPVVPVLQESLNVTGSTTETLLTSDSKVTSTMFPSLSQPGYSNSLNTISKSTTNVLTATNTVATFVSTLPKPPGNTYGTCVTVTITVTASCRGESNSAALNETLTTNILTGSPFSTITQASAPSRSKAIPPEGSSPKSIETSTSKSRSKAITLLGQNKTSTLPTSTFLQTQAITIQTQAVKDSSVTSSTIPPVSAPAANPSGETKLTTKAPSNSLYAQNTLSTSAGDATVTIWSTKAIMSTMTLTAPCIVCRTITSGTQITTSCSQSMNSTITATKMETVVPVTTQLSTQSVFKPFLSSQTEDISLNSTYSLIETTKTTLKNDTTILPTVPFLTTVTVPCSSCSKGMKTITSTCSTATSVATVTIFCPICPGGVKTTTTTTTISLTQSPSSSLPPFHNSSTIIDLKHVNTLNAFPGSVLAESTFIATSMISSSPVTISRSGELQPYPTSESTISSYRSSLTLGRSNSTVITTPLSSSISNSSSTTSGLRITYPTTSNVKTSISTNSTSGVTSPTSIISMQSKPSSSTVPSTTSIASITALTTALIKTSATTTTAPVPTCSQDACLKNMLDENHIENAHSYAKEFCQDRAKPTPTWLTACQNKVSATSAFQCVTASVTPVPSEDKDGRKCFKFQGQKIYGKERSQDFHQGYQKRKNHDMKAEGYLGRLWRVSKTGLPDEKHGSLKVGN